MVQVLGSLPPTLLGFSPVPTRRRRQYPENVRFGTPPPFRALGRVKKVSRMCLA